MRWVATDEAKAAVKEALDHFPDITIESYTGGADWIEAERQRMIETMRKAGFPACASERRSRRDRVWCACRSVSSVRRRTDLPVARNFSDHSTLSTLSQRMSARWLWDSRDAAGTSFTVPLGKSNTTPSAVAPSPAAQRATCAKPT